MAAYRRVYDSRLLQADCKQPGSAREPYAWQSSTGCLLPVAVLVIRAIPGVIANVTCNQYRRPV